MAWLPDALLDGFVEDYLATGDPKLSSVVFTIARDHPERVRPYQDRIDKEQILEGLLAGAPDSTVDELYADWRRTSDLDVLCQVALVRTEYALERVSSVRDELDPMDWSMLHALAGGLPTYRPVLRGYIGAPGKSPHVVGGPADVDEVPICPLCSGPAGPLLTLSADALPYALSQDPVFYWYQCTCDEGEPITVRRTEDGLWMYDAPAGKADAGDVARSLVLEEHPNQRGTSMRAAKGSTGHQVGGQPRWRDPDNHPRCPECLDDMPFLAFVDSSGPLDLGGIVYCFWCDGCGVSSTLVQE